MPCAQPQEADPDYDAEYAHHFHTHPGLLSVYERHPGFREWLREKEHGARRRHLCVPPFSGWVRAQLHKEDPFIHSILQ
jgi:hypothetical protein